MHGRALIENVGRQARPLSCRLPSDAGRFLIAMPFDDGQRQHKGCKRVNFLVPSKKMLLQSF
jgi:hypothetical protein